MIYHLCIDIAGVLKWPDGELKQLFKDKDGVPRSGKYVRDWLRLQLAHGKRVLPMSECKGFSFIDGCPGHEEEPFVDCPACLSGQPDRCTCGS